MAKKVFLGLVALTISLVSVAFAQGESPYFLTVEAGYTKLSEEGAPNGSFGVGGGVSYLVRPAVAIGAEVAYFNFGSTDVEGFDLKSSLSAIPVTGQVAFYIPTQSNISPYIGGGAGLYNLRASVEGAGVDYSDSSNKFGTNFGGGIKFASDSSVSYGVDVRYHVAFQNKENWNMIGVFGRLFF